MKRTMLIAILTAAAAWSQTPQTQKKQNDKPDATSQTKVKEETTPQTDYVCGMTIDPKTADAKYAYKGKMYYFCSRDDQQEFVKSPDKYIPKKK